MRGRPSIFNEKEVLQKAQQVFWSKGFTATSLEDILQAMGMGSGSFYNAFKGGKKEVFKKALHQRREVFKAFQEDTAKSEDPVGMIKSFYRDIAKADASTHIRGCIIANTIVEMSALDEELEKEAIAILKEVEQFYTKTIAKAQKEGKLKTRTAPEILGRYLITLWNGINVTRRMYPDNKLLAEQIEMQLEIIN
ncbi:TetR/AcrR family transcriptional regulator [Marivirga lumbricoides]|uniref:TetR/AcrR family transcriptional regulator n=1 Tax=Marivirga lumbricoides TaxID=1046115 RepID=A0A2T4DTN8_9BACT|nr:TetR/AcrR family transcriptional regulator [Marivirga lumbricoides]